MSKSSLTGASEFSLFFGQSGFGAEAAAADEHRHLDKRDRPTASHSTLGEERGELETPKSVFEPFVVEQASDLMKNFSLPRKAEIVSAYEDVFRARGSDVYIYGILNIIVILRCGVTRAPAKRRLKGDAQPRLPAKRRK